MRIILSLVTIFPDKIVTVYVNIPEDLSVTFRNFNFVTCDDFYAAKLLGDIVWRFYVTCNEKNSRYLTSINKWCFVTLYCHLWRFFFTANVLGDSWWRFYVVCNVLSSPFAFLTFFDLLVKGAWLVYQIICGILR